jgi:hypothetical protein
LAALTGGRTLHYWEAEDGSKQRTRAYLIAPAAPADTDAVVDIAEARKRA